MEETAVNCTVPIVVCIALCECPLLGSAGHMTVRFPFTSTQNVQYHASIESTWPGRTSQELFTLQCCVADTWQSWVCVYVSTIACPPPLKMCSTVHMHIHLL